MSEYFITRKYDCKLKGKQKYDIKALAVENLDINYRNGSIYFLSFGQAAIIALGNSQINSRLVWNFHQ
jgi:hypothetical protein